MGLAKSKFRATASQDNALATATQAAVTDKRHVITHISGAYSVALIGLIQVKDATTVIWESYVHNQLDVALEIEGTKGNAVSVELAASGTGGQLGKVNIAGYTEEA